MMIQVILCVGWTIVHLTSTCVTTCKKMMIQVILCVGWTIVHLTSTCITSCKNDDRSHFIKEGGQLSTWHQSNWVTTCKKMMMQSFHGGWTIVHLPWPTHIKCKKRMIWSLMVASNLYVFWTYHYLIHTCQLM